MKRTPPSHRYHKRKAIVVPRKAGIAEVKRLAQAQLGPDWVLGYKYWTVNSDGTVRSPHTGWKMPESLVPSFDIDSFKARTVITINYYYGKPRLCGWGFHAYKAYDSIRYIWCGWNETQQMRYLVALRDTVSATGSEWYDHTDKLSGAAMIVLAPVDLREGKVATL